MRHDRRDDPVTRLQARRTVANSLLAATLLMFGAIAGCTNPAEERLVGTWYGFVVPSPEDESEADPDAERWPDWILEFRDVERVTVRKWRVKGYTAEFGTRPGAVEGTPSSLLDISSEEGYAEAVDAPWEVLGDGKANEVVVNIEMLSSPDWTRGTLQFVVTFQGNDRFTSEIMDDSLRFERVATKP